MIVHLRPHRGDGFTAEIDDDTDLRTLGAIKTPTAVFVRLPKAPSYDGPAEFVEVEHVTVALIEGDS